MNEIGVFKALDQKDAEIERLKADKDLLAGQLTQSRSYVSTYAAEIERLKYENTCLHDALARLDLYVPAIEDENKSQKKLIRELADDIQKMPPHFWPIGTIEHIQRAREATRSNPHL